MGLVLLGLSSTVAMWANTQSYRKCHAAMLASRDHTAALLAFHARIALKARHVPHCKL